MTNKEQARVQVLNEVLEGKVNVSQASGLMGVSERHGWRLLAAYRKEGAAAVAHGNRGRKPATTTHPATQQKVRELATDTYAGFNHTHLTEMLAEREGIRLSRSTIRRVLLAGGTRSPRRRRAPKHRSRRERYPQEGMLYVICSCPPFLRGALSPGGDAVCHLFLSSVFKGSAIPRRGCCYR